MDYISVRKHKDVTGIDWGRDKNAIIHNYVIELSLKTYINSIIDEDCFRNRNYSAVTFVGQ